MSATGGPFFTLRLPSPWQQQAGYYPMVVDGRSPEGGRLAVWANSIEVADAGADVRRHTLATELERVGIEELVWSEGNLGDEPALIAHYDYLEKPHVQVSATRDGIEYRASLKAASAEDRDKVLQALAATFAYPDANRAAQVRGGLPRALNALDSGVAVAEATRQAIRDALPRGPVGPARKNRPLPK